MDHAGKRAELPLPETVYQMANPAVAPDRQAEVMQDSARLRRAMAALPKEKREVLVMSRFLELKYDEIASVLKCEVGTVKVRVYRALRELGDQFAALGGERAS